MTKSASPLCVCVCVCVRESMCLSVSVCVHVLGADGNTLEQVTAHKTDVRCVNERGMKRKTFSNF